MNKQEAKNIIKNTFSNEFNEKTFQNFIANLFKKPLGKSFFVGFKDAYKPFIDKCKVVGTFEDGENNK